VTTYPSAVELVAQARRGAESAFARSKGIRRASTVYVTEQTQRMYEGRNDRFRYLVTTLAPQRWVVRDGELQPVERILMSAPWSAATSVDALVERLLSSVPAPKSSARSERLRSPTRVSLF